MKPSRLEAFSDGVFAIAITLLVLNLDIGKTVRGPDLGHHLVQQWPAFVGFAVSFLSIGVMWINHHHVIDQVGRVDRVLLILNVLLLMCVAVIPFPTGLLAEHIRDSGARTAAIVYGVNGIALSVLFNAVWHYARRGGRLLRDDADPKVVSGITRSFYPGVPAYGLATVLAVVSPIASASLYAASAVFYAISSTLLGSDGA